jgi:hypothetical protein
VQQIAIAVYCSECGARYEMGQQEYEEGKAE